LFHIHEHEAGLGDDGVTGGLRQKSMKAFTWFRQGSPLV
jgi:hypothetical protein